MRRDVQIVWSRYSVHIEEFLGGPQGGQARLLEVLAAYAEELISLLCPRFSCLRLPTRKSRNMPGMFCTSACTWAIVGRVGRGSGGTALLLRSGTESLRFYQIANVVAAVV